MLMIQVAMVLKRRRLISNQEAPTMTEPIVILLEIMTKPIMIPLRTLKTQKALLGSIKMGPFPTHLQHQKHPS
jgi:hypothetical protein